MHIGHIEIIEILIDKGAEINAKDIAFRTSLYYALKNGHFPAAYVINTIFTI